MVMLCSTWLTWLATVALLVASMCGDCDAEDSLLLDKLKTAMSPESAVMSQPLSEHPACKEDLAAYASRCNLSPSDMKNNLQLLMCVQQRPPDQFEAITETCEQVLWKYKHDLTKRGQFVQQLEQQCVRDSESLQNCKNSYYPDQPGHYLSCVIELKHDMILKPACDHFITQIESIVFSDYRLIGDFAEKCEKDIMKSVCGRVSMKAHSDTHVFYHHSQGTVLECLGNHMESLNESCRHEMLRIAELQAEDYHLDRTLYFACRNDREQFCKDIPAGESRVYACLQQNIRKPELSSECREQLKRRGKLIAEDYKVSLPFTKACKDEIRSNRCRKGTDNMKPVRLAQILLCLEDVLRNEENTIGGRCKAEMLAHRKMLMNDYSLSPEVVTKCAKDIQQTCKQSPEKSDLGGMTIHCLMGLASQHKLQSGSECENEVRLLLRESDVVSDWTVDPVLKRACQDVVQRACDSTSGSSDAIYCLMMKVASQSPLVTSECKEVVMQIQYFLARDFSLDPKLYQKCKADAKEFCGSDDDWHLKSGQDGSDAKLVFPCLVRHLYGFNDVKEDNDVDTADYNDHSLSDDCASQVERVLEQRAVSVNLHPEIEDACRDVLIEKCAEDTGHGQELQCLQDHLDSLKGECLNAVKTYTQVEAKTAVLNPVIASSCHHLIDKYCLEEVSHKDEGDVVDCLIRLKDDHVDGMDDKCRAAVEHWQILSLGDWRFSYKFREACKWDVQKLCVKPKSKMDVISCLSKVARDDVLTDKKPPLLSRKCGAQLRFQLLQKHSNIELNPILTSACGPAIQKFCQNRIDVEECLKQRDLSQLSKACRQQLFQEEQEEVLDNSVDFVLLKNCKHEIKTHCQSIDQMNGILTCLKEVKEDPTFDRKCRKIVNERIMEHAQDYRLQPQLQKACALDVGKFCSQILLQLGADEDLTSDFFQGKVIQCLEAQFAHNADLLSTNCRKEIEVSMRDQALDYRANPEIVSACPLSIAACKAQIRYDAVSQEDNGKMEECLKTMFFDDKLMQDGKNCRLAVATIIEFTNADIHADPVLQEACYLDLTKFCREVPSGNSRQLLCLTNVLHDTKLSLEKRCSQLLQRRMEMFNMALKVVPIQGLPDIIAQVSMSPHKNYFVLVVVMTFSMFFIVGLLFGRVTKRVRSDLKNR